MPVDVRLVERPDESESAYRDRDDTLHYLRDKENVPPKMGVPRTTRKGAHRVPAHESVYPSSMQGGTESVLHRVQRGALSVCRGHVPLDQA